MPTVAELAQTIADDSGLDYTLDQAVILRALNRAQRSICSRIPMLTSTTNSTTAGDGTTDFFSIASYERIHNVLLCDSANFATGPFVEIVQGNPGDIALGRPASPPTHFYLYGQQLRLNGPIPVGQSMVINYDPAPVTLTIATASADINVPVAFHEDALMTLALAYILEGYEGDEQRASYYRQLANDAIQRLIAWAVRRGGVEAPNARFGAAHFETPDPLEIR